MMDPPTRIFALRYGNFSIQRTDEYIGAFDNDLPQSKTKLVEVDS